MNNQGQKTKEIENQTRLKLFLPEFNFNYNIDNKQTQNFHMSGFQPSVVKPKPNLSLQLITKDTVNPVNQSKLEVNARGAKRGKTRASKSRLVLILPDWMKNRHEFFLSQWCGAVNGNPTIENNYMQVCHFILELPSKFALVV